MKCLNPDKIINCEDYNNGKCKRGFGLCGFQHRGLNLRENFDEAMKKNHHSINE